DGIRAFHVTGVQTCALPILQWRVYPNPTKDIITIEFSEYGTEATVEIFNLLGQKVIDCGNIIGTQTLDMSKLTQGVYMLKINNRSEERRVEKECRTKW